MDTEHTGGPIPAEEGLSLSQLAGSLPAPSSEGAGTGVTPCGGRRTGEGSGEDSLRVSRLEDSGDASKAPSDEGAVAKRLRERTPVTPVPRPGDFGAFQQQLLERWGREAEETGRAYPGFDLARESRDPRFRSLLRSGTPIRVAYEALHHGELLRQAEDRAAREAEKRVVDGIRARGARPGENGTAGRSGFVVREDAARLSRRDVGEIISRVKAGERISFG